MKRHELHLRSIAARTGETTCIELPMPPEGDICKIVIVQTGGTLAGFDATLYNSEQVCGASQSSGGDDPAGAYTLSPELHQVGPTLTADAAGLLRRFLHGEEWNYCNMDGRNLRGGHTGERINNKASHTNRQGKLYLQLAVGGEGADATWDIAIGYRTDVSG
jgi:hypothetical protein